MNLMAENITVVPFEEKYLEQIISTQKELYSLNFADISSFFDLLYCMEIEGMYLDQSSRSAVMLDGEKVIGYYCYYPMYGSAYLAQLFIDSEYRQKGFGKTLFTHFEEDVKNNSDYYMILFEVSAMNGHAVEFYQRNGYRIVEEAIASNELRYTMAKKIEE